MIAITSKYNGRRVRQYDAKHAWLERDAEEDFVDDDFVDLGIILRNKFVPSRCPYDKDGNYIPRSKR